MYLHMKIFCDFPPNLAAVFGLSDDAVFSKPPLDEGERR
jgi:hypothetical protein